MVPQTGIEPATRSLGNCCSVQLSYWGIPRATREPYQNRGGCTTPTFLEGNDKNDAAAPGFLRMMPER